MNEDDISIEREKKIGENEIEMVKIEKKPIYESNFFEDNVHEVLLTTQKLCFAVKKILAKTDHEERFVDKINTKWHIIKTETQILDVNKTISKCIKSNIAFKRVCLKCLLDYEKGELVEIESDEMLKMIGTFYEGGLEHLVKDHSDLQDSLRLVHVEGVVGNLSKTALTVPYSKIKRKRPTKKKLFKDKLIKLIFNSFPPLSWVPEYLKNWKYNLKGDIVSGIIVGIMAIPQGMAYALVAGLPPVYGLYTAIFPVIIYAFTGTCRQLGVGPAAVISLLTHDALVGHGVLGTDSIVPVACAISFFAGIVQLGLGVLRLGFLASFLSHNFLSAFTTAAASYIICTYSGFAIGIKIPDSTKFFTQFVNLLRVLPQTNTISIGLAFSCGIFLYIHHLARKKYKWLNYIPVALIVIIFSTLISYKQHLADKHGILIVGTIPSGLPKGKIPEVGMVKEIIVSSVVIGFISFIETVAIGERFAQKYGYKLNANQELVSIGLANVVGSFVGCYPSTGSFSKSAIQETTGGRSLLASLIGMSIVLITIFTLTDQLYYLPKPALAAIIIVAVITMLDFAEVPKLWRKSKIESIVWLFSYIMTLVLGLQYGVFLSVGFSLVVVLFQVAFPDTYILGRLPGLKTYRPVQRFPYALVHPLIAVIRIDSLISFLNVTFVKKFVRDIINKSKPQVKVIVMDWSTVTSIDTTGVEALKGLIEEAKKNEILFVHAHVKGIVSDDLKVCGFFDRVNKENFFWQLHDAVLYASKYVMDIQEKRQKGNSLIPFDENLEEKQKTGESSDSDEKKHHQFDDESIEKFSEIKLNLTGHDDEEKNHYYSPLLYANDEEEETHFYNKCSIF
eukprot:TRINITY_DN7104_c0_g1_i1.p1 TRINITY_DN7104_c0_g1~~TRINITY_DN7104_c0_g1_i1.p1  ORF type:complete len:867 (+),score=155.41 TRINITY_DN7104_c0_g1_i1:64-2601(+)